MGLVEDLRLVDAEGFRREADVKGGRPVGTAEAEPRLRWLKVALSGWLDNGMTVSIEGFLQ